MLNIETESNLEAYILIASNIQKVINRLKLH